MPAGGEIHDIIELGVGGRRLNESRAVEVRDEGLGFGDQRLFCPAVEFAFGRYVGVHPAPLFLIFHSDKVPAEKRRVGVGG